MGLDEQLERRRLGTDDQGDAAQNALPPLAPPPSWDGSIETPATELEKPPTAPRVYSLAEVTRILDLAHMHDKPGPDRDELGLTEQALFRRVKELGITPEALSAALAAFNATQERDSIRHGAMTAEIKALRLPVTSSLDQLLFERKMSRDVKQIRREMAEFVSAAVQPEPKADLPNSYWKIEFPKDKVTFSGFGPLDRGVLVRAGWDVLKLAACGAGLAWGSGLVFGVAALYAIGVAADVWYGRLRMPTLFGPNLKSSTSSQALNDLLAFCEKNGITAKYSRPQRSFFRQSDEPETNTASLTFEIDLRTTYPVVRL